MKVLVEPGESGNIIASIAIGGTYFSTWEKFAFPNWKLYCERHQIGLVIFDENLCPEDGKSFQWQKLLIGEKLQSAFPQVQNICHLDTDILISPTAPNIFDQYDSSKIGLVSMYKRLPYPDLEAVQRRIAFLRHTFYSKDYPLDSSLFATPEALYQELGMAPLPDYACTGVFVFHARNHSRLFRQWFDKYSSDTVDKVGRLAEQTFLNYEIQMSANVQWLDYTFQCLWVYEMAWKFPFLYQDFRDNSEIIRACVESSLFTNHFIHFAGSWHESAIWKNVSVFQNPEVLHTFDGYSEYLKIPVTGASKGEILPRK